MFLGEDKTQIMCCDSCKKEFEITHSDVIHVVVEDKESGYSEEHEYVKCPHCGKNVILC